MAAGLDWPGAASRGLGYWQVDGPATQRWFGFELHGQVDVECVGEALEDGHLGCSGRILVWADSRGIVAKRTCWLAN